MLREVGLPDVREGQCRLRYKQSPIGSDEECVIGGNMRDREASNQTSNRVHYVERLDNLD